MKTNSGRVLEVPKPDEGPTTAQQLAELSATYQSTVPPCPHRELINYDALCIQLACSTLLVYRTFGSLCVDHRPLSLGSLILQNVLATNTLKSPCCG